MNYYYRQYSFLLLIILLLSSFSIKAGIIASSTRIIFYDRDIKNTLVIANTNDYPILSQFWVDDGENDSSPDQQMYPFVAVPAVLKLDPAEMSNLNIIYNNEELPKDRESVFWLNMYEIPSVKLDKTVDKTKLLMSMNTQMKIFYRPTHLKDQLMKKNSELSFYLSKNRNSIICNNRSPFYISFSNLSVLTNGVSVQVEKQIDMMIPPFSTKEYHIDKSTNFNGNSQIEANIINDDGNSEVQYYKLSH
ncbi:P pilus assembly chaperone PapD [Providencia alcalifaciens]|nr:P pilus assembly chaperone PapD [Providencia alcalifaciens]